jgi:putative transposase
MKMAAACLFRESCHLLLAPPAPVAVALRATRGSQGISALRFPRGSGYKTPVREDPKLPPRLRWIFAHNPLFFVTFCTYERRKLLASDPVHAAFVGFAEQAYSVHKIAVGRYVVMPDHVHLFVRGPDDFQLGPWVGMLKQALAKHIALAGRSPIWQRGFFDHVLRNDESYAQKWNYVRENPVRAGLVANAEDWPYSGEIVLIDRA